MALSREQFSKSGVAEKFATSKVHSDKDFLDKIAGYAKQGSMASVLDVATGTGFVAVQFAQKTSGLVVGTDITRQMLGYAKRHALKEGTEQNTLFLVADAAHQPFPDRTYDIVVSRLAMHHIPEPFPVIEEMARLCKRDGRVIIADQISPEDDATAEFHDMFERYRDPSHQRALKLSEFKEAYGNYGLKNQGTEFSPVQLELDDWASRAGCHSERIRALKQMMLEARPAFRDAFKIREENGQVIFQLDRVIMSGTP